MARVAAGRGDTIAALAEVFRQHGYEGASLSLISKATGLGKGSLYHVFPGGKDDMARAVLDAIEDWFETNVFAPLLQPVDPRSAIDAMFDAVATYFHSGQRICLVGLTGLSDARNRFAETVSSYFVRWIDALCHALVRVGGLPDAAARGLAEEVVAGIQGAIVLARAVDSTAVFTRIMRHLRSRVIAACGS